MADIVWHEERIKQLALNAAHQKLEKAAQELTDHIKVKLSAGRRGSVGTHASQYEPHAPPHVDTGALRQSIFWRFVDNNRVRVGTSKTYGLYLELGAYIRPKSAKMLAIPWSPEARRHSRNGGSARTFPIKLTPITSKKGGAVLLIQFVKGSKARGVIHYILTAHARIPPHPFLRPSLNEMRGRIQEIFSA